MATEQVVVQFRRYFEEQRNRAGSSSHGSGTIFLKLESDPFFAVVQLKGSGDAVEVTLHCRRKAQQHTASPSSPSVLLE